MQVTFLTPAGVVKFVRDDMEQGNWTQEEYTVNATFPFDPEKVITRGQRIMFRAPADDAIEVFEIRNVTNVEPEHYQQIIAEHIAVAELSDEHTNNKELTNVAARAALSTVLSGTQWAVGNVAVSRLSSANIARGSVWQAVNTIAANWNAYAVPRVTINNAGAITGRYIDITEATGVWRGVRLAIDKNMSDATIVYDDSEVLTALYGYGGSVEKSQSGDDDTTEELTFAGVTWSATSAHPAKPAGQTYLEDPAKTAIYGRNGRPRFGFYQNGDITDANILLQKTWDALKATSAPRINISGTCSDLHRFGYKDEPLRLHDIAIVEIRETGESFYLQIIKLDVDLVDATATRPEIGSYIPNIIYINRETNEYSAGRGGRGGRGQTNKDYSQAETYSALEKTDNMIGMVVGTRNGNNYIKAGEIALSINKSGETGQYESTALINANHVNISATDDVHTLAGDVEHDANGRLIIKSAGGMYVRKTKDGIVAQYGVFDNDNLTGGVIVEKVNDNTVTTHIKGDRIVIGTLDNKDLNDWATDAKNGTGVFVKYLTVKQLTAQELNTILANIGEASIEKLTVTTSVEAGRLIAADTLQVGPSYAQVKVANVVPDGNTLRITYTDGTEEKTFSKAVSLPTGTWIGNVTAGKSFQYQAKQNNVVVGTGYSPAVDSIYRYAAVVWDSDNKGFSVKLRAQDENGVDLIEEEITFDTTVSFNAGMNSTTIRPTNIGVNTTSGSSTVLTSIAASRLVAGRYLNFTVGSTRYSIPIT